ncbi:hypothetical protein [Streptomyces sp. t99]|uniref:hypothetical protein n=1 Tax=Streptomyces sp. t99 TaxID=1828172 RepID=UPI00117DA72D|nr:hypothetical protein [Streptomyces sp. t99]
MSRPTTTRSIPSAPSTPPIPSAPKQGRRQPRWRLAATAAALMLCAAPVASAAPGTTPGTADGRPPAHGAAPLYISDSVSYTHL